MRSTRRSPTSFHSIFTAVALVMLCAVSSGAPPPPVRPAPHSVPRPVDIKPQEFPVARGDESPSRSEQIGSTFARDPASILGTKAVVGHIEQNADLSSVKTAGEDLLREDFHEAQRRSQRALSISVYDKWAKDKFKETALTDFETSISTLSGKRGYIIFSGNWMNGNSLIKLSRPHSVDIEYALIRTNRLAYATLYLPYLTAFDISYAATSPMTKATAPIVAIDTELFSYEQGPAIRHRELLFDPRADVRVFYKTGQNETVEMKSVESRQLEFEPGKAEPATIERFLGCCVYVRPPAYRAQLVKFLKSIRFNVSQMRIALMVHDSATRSHLAGDPLLSSHGRAEAIDRRTTDIELWVVSQLKKASGGTLLLLGHVEGADYVVRDSSGNVVGKIPVRRTNELALLHGVTLLNLGCKTADTLHEHDGIGVYDAFNSIHMLHAISTAVNSGPATIADFLEKLGTPEARIVIPASILKNKDALATLRSLRDPGGKNILQGNRVRVPAIQPIVSPNGTKEGFPTSLSVFLTSGRYNQRGFYPVVAELHIVMDPCKVLSAAKKLKWDGSDKFTCDQYRKVPYIPVITHLYGNPERRYR